MKTISLDERLNAHPELKEYMLTLLDLADCDICKADEVEDRTIEGVHQLGQQVIQDWAHQRQKAEIQCLKESELDYTGKGKKNFTGRRPLEK